MSHTVPPSSYFTQVIISHFAVFAKTADQINPAVMRTKDLHVKLWDKVFRRKKNEDPS